MATLKIRNLPGALLNRLQQAAELNRRSVEDEALSRLQASLRQSKEKSVEETVASLRRLHAKMEDLRPIDDEFLQWAKEVGRP